MSSSKPLEERIRAIVAQVDARKLINDRYLRLQRLDEKKSTHLCPFHNDSEPSSFYVYKTRFECTGCRSQGNIIAFIMRYKNATLKRAVSIAESYL